MDVAEFLEFRQKGRNFFVQMLEKRVKDIAASFKFFLEKERVESHLFWVRQTYILGICIL